MSNVFEDAADYLMEHGWCQNRMYGENGTACAIGALQRVAFDKGRVDGAALATLRLHTHLGLGEHVSIAHWNDRPERTAEDVILAFKELANGD